VSVSGELSQIGAHPDALTTLGTLALGDNDSEAAMHFLMMLYRSMIMGQEHGQAKGWHNCSKVKMMRCW